MIVTNMLITGVSTYPLYIAELHRYYGSYFLFYREYVLSAFHCKAVALIFLWCHHTCLFSVLLTACHHCILVVYPFKDHRLMANCFSRALPLFLISVISFTVVLQVMTGLHATANDSSCQLLLKANGSDDLWSYVNFVLITAEFVMHTVTATIHFLTSFKLQNVGRNIVTHGGSRLKQRASIKGAIVGIFEIICLIMSSIIQVLTVVIGYPSDTMLVLVFGLLFYELLLPLLYTFTTTAFTNAMSSALSHIYSTTA